VVRLNTMEGKKLGLNDGDEAVLATELGEMRVRVKLDPRERKDSAVCRRGGWIKAGHGVNRLIPAVVSRAGEGAAYYEVTAAVRKAG
jgi:anaerobic selenocysteine-containing dehydrogenase